MMPTVRPFMHISIDPIMTWEVLMPDTTIKKLPVLVAICKQTGYTWYKILLDWSTKSMTLALLMLQFRFGRVESIVSDRGTNLVPANVNPVEKWGKEERRLMDLVHKQTPVGGQHSNLVETRIKLIKRYCYNLQGKAKGEKLKPIDMVMTDFILAAALSEVNNIPLFRHDRYVYLTPAMLVSPTLELSIQTYNEKTMVEYYDAVGPYLHMIADLRYDCFVQYAKQKRQKNHDLVGQGYETPKIGDYVMVKDPKKFNWIKYGIIMEISENRTKALVRTKTKKTGEWYILPMLIPLISEASNK